jgi:hypothetical protein
VVIYNHSYGVRGDKSFSNIVSAPRTLTI